MLLLERMGENTSIELVNTIMDITRKKPIESIVTVVDSIENGKTGVLFPVGDVEALAGIMKDCLENPDKYRNMRINAKARVHEFFTADLLYNALKGLYLELAGNRSGVVGSGKGSTS